MSRLRLPALATALLLGLSSVGVTAAAPALPGPASSEAGATPAASRAGQLPGGGRRIFAKKRFLVAYYGTAGTASLGVLGETSPERAARRIARAAKPFRHEGEQIMPVYELIVTVADGIPGSDGDYSHDIAHSLVQPYIDAAHEHGVLLLLDLQPGRSDFLAVAKRWQWALEDPFVGLALDPEWRMGPRQVPGRTLGAVRADEVNRTSSWLARLTADLALPEKVLMIHQFAPRMVPDIGRVRSRDGLAMVQHVDGYGTPAQKLATYAAVARPRQFTMGFKLFYDEDVPRMRAAAVRWITPPVRFVSFQ